MAATDSIAMDPAAYAERIGADWPAEPNLDTLDELIWKHQCTVPFENIQCFDEGSLPSMNPESIYRKVVVDHRGGYCFELNKIFMWFLGECGYDARPASCCVLRGKDSLQPMLHRATLVDLDGTTYYCDVGFGGPQPPGAIPLGGDRTVRGERFLIVKGEGPWWFLDRYDSSGQRERVMGFWDFEVNEQYFVPYNYFCASNPVSLFVRKRLLNLRLPDGSLALTDDELTERKGGETRVTTLRSTREVSDAIRELFGFEVPEHVLKQIPGRKARFP